MANQSYMKDRLGFDPDELLNEVDDLFHNNPDDDDFESPSHKKFKTYKPSPSSSTSSMLTYESALRDVKGKTFDYVCGVNYDTACIYFNIASHFSLFFGCGFFSETFYRGCSRNILFAVTRTILITETSPN